MRYLEPFTAPSLAVGPRLSVRPIIQAAFGPSSSPDDDSLAYILSMFYINTHFSLKLHSTQSRSPQQSGYPEGANRSVIHRRQQKQR